MAYYRCETCGGEYEDPQRDGTRYFHACPPVVNPKYADDPEASHTKSDFYIPRPDHRDENIVVDEATGNAGPKAVGKGRSEVPDGR